VRHFRNFPPPQQPEQSFFSTLTLELDLDDNRNTLISPQELQRDLAFWIENYSNHEHHHATIGYLSSSNRRDSRLKPLE
jgi:transposase InsO family protein